LFSNRQRVATTRPASITAKPWPAESATRQSFLVTSAPRTSKAERQSESDDEVRRNIGPDLIPVFNKVKGAVRGSPRITRTEAFLEWVEEHPEEVYSAQQHKADLELARLIAQEREYRRALRRDKIAGVPF